MLPGGLTFAVVAVFAVTFCFGFFLDALEIVLLVVPIAMPPLLALAGVAAQIVGLVTVRKSFDWSRAMPYLAGGAVGVPLGVAALAALAEYAVNRNR